MRDKRFAVWFRKESNWTFWSIVAVGSVMWLGTLLDFGFGLGWDWDKRGLIVVPVILLIATIIRFWHSTVDKLMDRLSNGD